MKINHITKPSELKLNYSYTFKQVRKSMGLSIYEMAEILDTSPSTISQYEAGNRRPKLEVFIWYLEHAKKLTHIEIMCPRCSGKGVINTLDK